MHDLNEDFKAMNCTAVRRVSSRLKLTLKSPRISCSYQQEKGYIAYFYL